MPPRNPLSPRDPASSAAVITKSDTVGIVDADGNTRPCRAIYVGGAGDLVILCADDSVAVTFTAVPAGTVLPVSAKRVNSTNTTATAMVALF